MNELDIIKETLNSLVNWKNSIESNSKTINSLPVSTNGNKLVAVHNETSLETEKFDLSSALQGFNQLNDKITELGTITRVSNTFTFSIGYEWILNGLNYANTIDFDFTINVAASGKLRNDIIVLDTTNSLILIQGFESTDIAQQPETPPNTLLLCVFSVTDSAISNPVTNTNKLVKKINGNANYTLIQSDIDKYLLIETEFDLILPLGLNDNSEFVIKNISGSSREIVNNVNVIFKGARKIQNNALCLLKKIDFDGTNEIYSVNSITVPQSLNDTLLISNIAVIPIVFNGVSYQIENINTDNTTVTTLNVHDDLLEIESGAGKSMSFKALGDSSVLVPNTGGVDKTMAFEEDIDLSGLVPTTRTVNGKALSSDITLNTDDISESGTPTNKWFTENRVLNTILTAISFVTNSTITASDTILSAFGKLQAQITYILANYGRFFLKDITTTTFTGVSTQSILKSITLPANTFYNGLDVDFDFLFLKDSTASVEFTVWINTSNSLTGASKLGLYTCTAANRNIDFTRRVMFESNSLNINATGIASLITNKNVATGAGSVSFAYTYNQQYYLIVTCTNTDTTTTSTFKSLKIKE